ncbi:MAG: PIN domain-containing protein [Verrucomicrobia bacterium]|nr:PIN domain-containing protein [Verrucomicrobiota bacterium]
MRADFRVVLDACVLANYGVANLLLLLAEKPRLYLPAWSDEILAETRRTQIDQLGWEARLADSFQSELCRAFPEGLVNGYEHVVGQCSNDEKDRHVLACAIHCNSELILTFNLRHFPEDALAPWGVSAFHPQDYLITLFDLEPLQVMHQLGAIAQKRGCTIEDHLIDLGKFLPQFSSRLLDELNS